MWGFQAENGGGNLFRPAAALYSVTTSNWNTLALTDTGKAYQDLLGIQDWDGNPNNGWTTHLNATNGNAPTVGANGTINFTGYYGTYNLKIGATTYPLNLAKGTSNYTILVNPTKGDFDLDGTLTNSDIQAMLLALGNPTAYQAANGLNGNDILTLGDFNNDHALNTSDLQQLLVNLTTGAVAGPGDLPAVVPEPSTAVLGAGLRGASDWRSIRGQAAIGSRRGLFLLSGVGRRVLRRAFGQRMGSRFAFPEIVGSLVVDFFDRSAGKTNQLFAADSFLLENDRGRRAAVDAVVNLERLMVALARPNGVQIGWVDPHHPHSVRGFGLDEGFELRLVLRAGAETAGLKRGVDIRQSLDVAGIPLGDFACRAIGAARGGYQGNECDQSRRKAKQTV